MPDPPADPPRGVNTVLYCRRFDETVAFYERALGLARGYSSDWFVEFHIAPGACLSVADERRASVKSASGAGITLTFQVTDVAAWHARLERAGAAPGPAGRRPFGATGFLLHDPEGNRIEVWAPGGR